MELDFVTDKDHDFLAVFAKKFKARYQAGRVSIPASLGKGSIRRIDLDPDIKMVIHHYRLKEEFIIRRKSPDTIDDLVTFIFHSNESPVNMIAEGQPRIQMSGNNESAIQIASSNLNSVSHFPANTDIYFTVVAIRRDRLKNMLHLQKRNNLVESILSETTFLFYESMDRETQKVLRQITEYTAQDELNTLYYMFNVQHLLYILFQQLLQRDAHSQQPINKTDIEMLFVVRTSLLADLGKPPYLPELAAMAGMSETKLKRLFKQVFGDSIYNYFQKSRMEEAAFLLSKGGHSVAQTGYELGFSNLSHFSRLFEKHYGATPKKFSLTK